jgi:hypothetical protein
VHAAGSFPACFLSGEIVLQNHVSIRPRALCPARLAAGLAVALTATSAIAASVAPSTSSTFTPRHLRDARSLLARRPPMQSAHRAIPHGTAIPVTSCGDDGDPGTLRNAIAGAASGDTVDASQLTCGKITLASGAISISLDDLTIVGPGQSLLTVDGGGIDSVLVHTGQGTLTVSDITLSHGHYVGDTFGLGGCVYSTHDVAMTNVTVTGCSAETNFANAYGGGVMARGSLTLTSSTISNNNVTGGEPWGGGAYAGVSITATDSTITGNTATGIGGNAFIYGGGLTSAGSIALTGSTVSSNLSNNPEGNYVYGGGVAAGTYARITSSTITANMATAAGAHVRGGGLITFAGAYLTASAVDHNNAGGGGGIAIMSSTALLDIVNSTISSNIAPGVADDGGGGVLTYGPIEIDNSTIALNSAVQGGGGVLFVGAGNAFGMQSSIVANNDIGSGAYYAADIGSAAGVTISGAGNLVVSADATLPAGTLQTDPMLLPLANNGGPTRTHALAAASPAIDAGNDTAALDFDQRGDGFARIAGNAADIGAFELQSSEASQPPSLSKAFTPGAIEAGTTTTLTLTLGNSNSAPATLQSALTDNFPAGLVVAAPSHATTTCTAGTVEADAGAFSLTLDAGAVIPAQSTCTVSVSVTAATQGGYVNTVPAGALDTDLGANAEAAIATLTVELLAQPPTAALTFDPDAIALDGVSTLTLTLSNANKEPATLTADMILGPFASAMTIADPANATTTCPGGVLTGASGDDQVSMAAGAEIPPQAGCEVSVDVTVNAISFNFVIFPADTLLTDLGSNPDEAVASLSVDPTVTPSAGPGGSISPDTPQLVAIGGSLDLVVTPDTGFRIADVAGTCGGQLIGTTYTTFSVKADCTVEATFEADVVDSIFADGFDSAAR